MPDSETPVYCEICRDHHERGEHLSLDEMDKRYILRMYEATGKNKMRTAVTLKITRLTLKRRLYRYS